MLSTVWNEPAAGGGERPSDADPGEPELDHEPNENRSQVVAWLLAPTTRRRALTITTVAAVACGGFVAAGELDDSPPDISTPAVTVEDVDSGPVEADTSLVVRRALSADNKLRLRAEQAPAGARTWTLEAEPISTADPGVVIRFTVNGVVVEEIDRAPYRLLLDAETLSSLVGVDDTTQPLIVTATARWSDADLVASPATAVLSR